MFDVRKWETRTVYNFQGCIFINDLRPQSGNKVVRHDAPKTVIEILLYDDGMASQNDDLVFEALRIILRISSC